VRVVETEMHLFLRKRIVTLSLAAYIKLGATVLIESHHFSLLPSHLPLPLLFTACCTVSTPCSMADATIHDPAPHVAPSVNDEDSGNDSGVESVAMATSSSPTRGATKMAYKKILELTDFFKKMTVTEDDRKAYHDRGWVASNLLSFTPEVDVPIVDGSTVLCFESQLIAGLGLPPSKFLSSIMNYLGCSLIHLNPNTVSALSSFVMLCECWLRIPPDTSIFWYYYYPA
jgi:hypothetical protein